MSQPRGTLYPLAVRLETEHLVREPLDHLEAYGFEVEQVERSKSGSSSAWWRAGPPEP